MFFLPTVNLLKWHELGISSNFGKSSLNLIESDPGTLERIIMQFWPKEATQDTFGLLIDDPLPTQKNGHKIFFDEKMVEIGLVEISTVPNRPFGARGDRIFFGPCQMASKALVKCF